MIELTAFLTGIRAIRELDPIYRLGGSGVDGTCDCIGLIIGAIRRAGGSWTGTHGSNYAARSEMTGLRRITSASGLSVGEAVYKARTPEDAGYDLPSKYQASGDLLDYYHVGVVMAVAPLEIWHCTTDSGSGGIKVDTRLGAWAWAGRLKKIDYDGSGVEEMTQKATVTAPSGSTVNLRSTPDTSEPYLARVPLGTVVDVLELGSEWCAVIALGKRGYMMRRFLVLEGDGDEPDDLGGDYVTRAEHEAKMADFEARLAALEARVDGIEGNIRG